MQLLCLLKQLQPELSSQTDSHIQLWVKRASSFHLGQFHCSLMTHTEIRGFISGPPLSLGDTSSYLPGTCRAVVGLSPEEAVFCRCKEQAAPDRPPFIHCVEQKTRGQPRGAGRWEVRPQPLVPGPSSHAFLPSSVSISRMSQCWAPRMQSKSRRPCPPRTQNLLFQM